MLVGAWSSVNEADKAGLSLLSRNRDYEDLEKDCQRLVQLNDAPVWSIGTYRGVVSKIDLLYAVAGYVTRDDLVRYFDVARMVLGEDDPSLDLADDQRWTASIHGKTREFSSVFRKGIGEMLVLLAVHGVALFKRRLGIDTEEQAALVVRDLLKTPLTTRALEANDRDLPLYAEAAPTEFLSIIERDLQTDEPAVFGLLRPAGTGIFANPSRTGLLWALEGLAWNPDTLPRTVMVLARLTQIEINDNWKDKPGHSLGAIFRDWMPQTAAGHDDRLGLVKTLFRKFPGVAWTLCIAQFGNHHAVGDYSHKPVWRPYGYGYGFGEPFATWGPILEFRAAMVELALTRDAYTPRMLYDLIDRLHDLGTAEQGRVWALIKEWASTASDGDKVAMRDKIRISTLSRRAAVRAKKNGKEAQVAATAKSIYEALEPGNLVDKHAWLFKAPWIEESADELENIDSTDYEERDRRILVQRANALKDIHETQGIDGLLDLAIRCGASGTVGAISAEMVLNKAELLGLISHAFNKKGEGGPVARASDWLIQGIVGAIAEDSEREAFLTSAISEFGPENAIPLLILAPFGEFTWSLVESQGTEAEESYWRDVVSGWIRDSSPALTKAVEKLMKARRPRAAFAVSKYNPKRLPV